MNADKRRSASSNKFVMAELLKEIVQMVVRRYAIMQSFMKASRTRSPGCTLGSRWEHASLLYSRSDATSSTARGNVALSPA